MNATANLRTALVASAACVTMLSAVAARAGTIERSEASGRSVRVFVPETPAAKPAAVLMLHGCTQTADGFAEATRMDALAEESGFYVVYIEQPSSLGTGSCYRWWDPAHQARGAGEPKELSDAMAAVVADKGIDPERVYVAGLSAGAAMSVILGATYPDRFAALGAMAGLPFKAATSFGAGVAVTQTGDVDASALGDLAKAAMGDAARVVPVLVMHGTSDGTVSSTNGTKLAEQWVRTNAQLLGADSLEPPHTTTGEAGGYAITTTVHRSKATSASVVELVLVKDLAHAWPGGLEGGSYADPRGPDASRALWSFFAPRTKSIPLPVTAPPSEPDGGEPTTPPATSQAAPTPHPASDEPPAAGATPETSDVGGCSVPAAPGASSGGLALSALAALAAWLRRKDASRRAR